MFFKKRVPVAAYCEEKLTAMFSQEQREKWLRLQVELSDSALHGVPERKFVDEMLGANLQLLSMAITKQYRDINMMAEVYSCVKAFLENNQRTALSRAKDEYNKAFGSSHADGVLQMARLFNSHVAEGRLSSETEKAIYESMYETLATYFAEFKTFKLMKSW